MRAHIYVTTVCMLAALASPASRMSAAPAAQRAQPWIESFPVNVKELVTEGESPYFILKPGYQLTLEGRGGGKAGQLVITVLADVVNIGGIDTRVVEERETSGGQLAEVSRNFFAIHPETKDVFYFGEEVDTYKNGKLDGHEGAWRHGANNARFGLMMPGTPSAGQRFYQELAPKVAMDRIEIISVSEKSTTPAGVFERCVKARETTPLERFVRDYKVYAPGIGMVEDGPLKLVSHKYVQPASR